MYLKPAAAFLALLCADPIDISHADRAQYESATTNKNGKHEVLERLVNSAEFHRAMKQEARRKKKIGQLGRRHREMRESRRASFAANHKSPPVLRTVHIGGVSHSEQVECDPNLDHDEPDVGVLSFSGCGEDHFCAPSELSPLGGICVPDDTEALSGRHLQDGGEAEEPVDEIRCYEGCPMSVCQCLDARDTLETQECFEAVLESCRDGVLVNTCASNPEKPIAQAYCEYYECLDETYGVDAMFVQDEYYSGYNCFCRYYESMCDQLSGPCGNSTSGNCEIIEGVCEKAVCCQQYGGEVCLTESYEPTMEPTLEPTITNGTLSNNTGQFPTAEDPTPEPTAASVVTAEPIAASVVTPEPTAAIVVTPEPSAANATTPEPMPEPPDILETISPVPVTDAPSNTPTVAPTETLSGGSDPPSAAAMMTYSAWWFLWALYLFV